MTHLTWTSGVLAVNALPAFSLYLEGIVFPEREDTQDRTKCMHSMLILGDAHI